MLENSRKVDEFNQRQQSQKDRDILDWLTTVDYGSQQSDFISRRQEGTGEWLLCTDEFTTWLNQKNKTLFCSGIPGAGKTILTSIAINHLNDQYAADHTIGIAYIYFNFRRKDVQKAKDLLLSLLKQFLQGQVSLPESVKTLYEHHSRKRTRPSLKEVEEELLSAVSHYSRAFIVVDALDECGVSDSRREVFLSSVFNLQAKTGTNIFATSRINNKNEKVFDTALCLKIHANKEDVIRYLNGQMSLMHSDIWDDDLRDQVRWHIVRAFDGMYETYQSKRV